MRDATMSAMAEEIHKKCSSMDVEEFLGEFLPRGPPDVPDSNVAAFQKIAEKTTETAMYGPLINALAPFCVNMHLVDTHATSDPQSGDFNPDLLKPDITVYKAKDIVDPITQFSRMETHIELKLASMDDAFNDEGALEPDSELSHDTRGQLVSYANAQMASQYRIHLFTAFICADKERLLRWDRSGVIVTRAFPYDSGESTYLQEFFWRLSHADDATRGWDITVTEPTLDEAALARHSLSADESEVLYKFAVYDDINFDAEPTYFIAGRPFESHAYPTGRSTRCFIAYHLADNRNVFMKDTWRIVAPDLVAEGRIYERLHKAEILHIAKFIVAGDIPGPTHKTVFKPGFGLQRQYQHYRLVLGTIGRPLASFCSSWETVNAVKDALVAHQQAFEKLQIMHQDISVGNILITEDVNGHLGGILVDWNLCQSVDNLTKGSGSVERTIRQGTWQFISAKLLLDPAAPRTITDELESFLHVLTWVAIMFTPTAMSPVDLSSTLRLCYEEIWGDPEQPMGGLGKRTAIQVGMSSIKMLELASTNLDELLSPLNSSFGAWYGSELYSMLLEEDPPAAQTMLDLITKALQDRAAWPADDCARLNSVFKARERPNRKRKSDSELEDSRPAQKARLAPEEHPFVRCAQICLLLLVRVL
ncbi:hypothetical protein ARMSODRAFT_933988 [Armillaria solidipes]|uniref:Fungal-type protein kinase domain-containing protein n=1 Tax=Armillaria solidipes TaxID=1076256 RepID=A0A2H3BZ29_9AGAR|nr:hypothetical protein ARMSODRAFT_933988 [Armillaria solidipes]